MTIPSMDEQEETVAALTCPHCGNDDVGLLSYCDWVLCETPLGEKSTSTQLYLDDGQLGEVDWDTAKDAGLFCKKCGNHFPIPEGAEEVW